MLLTGFGLACALASSYFAVADASHGMVALGLIYGIAAVGCVICVLAFRRSARLLLWGNLFIGLLFAITALANLGGGGRLQGVNMVLPTLVMVAALMLDRRSAIAWSVLILAQILFAHWLAQRPMPTLFRVVEGWDDTAYQRVPLVMVVLSIFLAIWFKQMIERIQRHLLELHRSEREARGESERLNRMLAEMAAVDPLTGLLNRRAAQEALEDELQRSRRLGEPFSVLMIDADHFKSINDLHGHAVGDRALQHLGTLLSAQMRDIDRVGRWGGEEFIVLLPGTPLAQAQEVAERLRERTQSLPPRWQERAVPLTVSLGVSQWAGPSDELSALMARADAAMYRAKANGRNRVEVEPPPGAPRVSVVR